MVGGYRKNSLGGSRLQVTEGDECERRRSLFSFATVGVLKRMRENGGRWSGRDKRGKV